MAVTVECRRCGHEREASREAIAIGTWRHECPVCRPSTASAALDESARRTVDT